ncbi:MAG: VWA domain-containing protein [Myxococcota bacterium]
MTFGLSLTGLSLGQVLGVLGVAGGAVVVLYLLKLRRRRVAVPFVKLWEQVLAEKQTTRLFSQLKRWLSLLVALSVVAALGFALGDPRPDGVNEDARTLIVLVDASASMQARDVEPSRFDRAKQEAERLVQELGPSDRMLIAQLDGTATPLSPLTSEPRVLLDAIEQLEAAEVAADLRAGLHLALDVLRGQPGPEVVLLSDGNVTGDRFNADAFEGRLEEGGVRLSWVKIGEGGDNVAITAFSVRRYPLDKSQSEVLVELYNASENEESVELTLLGDGEPVDVQRLTLRPDERLRRFFRNVSGVDQTLEAKITRADGTRDPLVADDAAFARLPERRRARLCVVTEGNLYLQAALLLDEYLDVEEIPPAQYPCEGRFDLLLFDNWAPPTTPEVAALYLGLPSAEEGGGPLEVVGDVQTPYFDQLDRRHPLLKWTALRDVNIGRAREVRLQQGDRAIGRSDEGPLMVVGSREGQRFVAFTFDPRESDLPLRVAWPLLLLNTVDWFVQEDVGFVSSFQTGETWHIPAPASLREVTVVDPSGDARTVPVVEGRAIYAGVHTGFHTLQTPDGEELFAANLGAGEESRIEPAESLSVGAASAGEPTKGELGVRREIWLYLVLFALGVLLVEWLTYHRRVTV